MYESPNAKCALLGKCDSFENNSQQIACDISLLLETVPMPGWRRAAQNLPLVLILPVFFIIVVSVTCNDSSFASSLEHGNTGIG